MRKIKVLIVDDSALVRQILSEILNSDPEIEVIGAAADPFSAARKMRDIAPDVITLDIEMPNMDGLTFLQKIMQQHPMPVVICSALTEKNSSAAMKALELGAAEIIAKPRIDTKKFFSESRIRICDVIKAVHSINVKKSGSAAPVEPKLSADAVIENSGRYLPVEVTEKIIVVGASTGGTEALRVFLTGMPQNSPGIVIVQHMPEHFTYSFAQRLDSLCRLRVKEASNGDEVRSGEVLIAPGNFHMLLKRANESYFVEVKDGPLVNRHRPSVDVLFRSAARYAGSNSIGIIMTGMGDDGAKGLLELKNAGAFTIAQDEASSVVYGMPQAAARLGAACRIMPLENMSKFLKNYLNIPG